MSQKFTKQWNKPFTRCFAKRDNIIGEPPVLKSSDGRLVVMRKRGSVTTRSVGSSQRINLTTNTFVSGPTIIETGTDQGVVKIGGLGGASYLIGPGMRVRVEANKPIEILRHTPGVSFDIIEWRPDSYYKVRTANCVLSARG